MSYDAGELVVGVTYYNNRIDSMNKCCKEMDKNIELYRKLLKASRNDAIIAGETAEVLDAFITQVNKLNGIMSNLAGDYEKLVIGFLSDIDIADDLLYDSSFKGRKYFTDTEFKRADRVLSHQPFSLKEFFNWAWQGIFEIYWRNCKENTGVLVNRVENLDKKTARKLNAIKKNVRSTDRRYSKKFEYLDNHIITIETALKKINEIVEPTCANFDIDHVKELKSIIREIQKQNDIIKNGDFTPDEAIIEFAKNTDIAIKYFSSIDKVFKNFINDEKDLIVINKYTEIKNEMVESFNRYSQDYVASSEDFEKYKNNVDEYIDAIKKYGDGWKKYVDGDCTFLNRFLNGIGGIKKFEKFAENYREILYQLLFSMDESKKALSAFEKNCDLSDKNVKKALEHLKSLYNKELFAFLDDVVEQIVSDEWTTIKDLLKKGNIVTKVIGYAIDGIEYKRNSLGVNDKMDAIALYSWVVESEKAYENAIYALNNADKTSKKYLELVQNSRYCFDIAKNAKLAMLKKIIDSSKDWEKDYYQYCYNQLRNASMSDSSRLNIMSKETYRTYGNNTNPIDSILEPI